MKTISILTVLALSACGSGAPTKPDPGPNWAREGGACRCDKCRCNHCKNEAGAKCYCSERNQKGVAVCACGLKSATCACEHCAGKAAAKECACGK